MSSIYFPRNNIYKYTWVSPNSGVHNPIDHMISKRYASSIGKVRTHRGVNADLDRYLLFAQFNLRLFTKWNIEKKLSREMYNIQRLEDPEVQKRFVIRVQESIQTNH